MDLVFLIVAGAFALSIGGLAVFSDGADDVAESDVDEGEESEAGELLSFADGPDVTGTEGDDTIIATGDIGEADGPPRGFSLDLLGGDDVARFNDFQMATINAGSGDDTIISTGGASVKVNLEGGDDYFDLSRERSFDVDVSGGEGDDFIRFGEGDFNSVEGGSGNDTIEVGAGVSASGGPGDDVITITGTVSQSGTSVDAGNGDDVLNITARAGFTLFSGLGTATTIDATTGEGADVVNLSLTIEERPSDPGSYPPSILVGVVGQITDFDVGQDTLRVEIFRSGDTLDRVIDPALIAPVEADDPYNLTFEAAATAIALDLTASFRIFADGPLTLDDIEIVGLDPAAGGGA